MIRLIIIALWIASFSVECTQPSKKAVVQRVIDGDTFVTNTGEVIRLANLDAAEIAQVFGYESKMFLQRCILNTQILLRYVTTDTYERKVCNVYLNSGLWINKLVVDSGYAWAYKRYSVLYEAQIKARRKHIGLWKQEAIPPFIFRRQLLTIGRHEVAIQTKPLPTWK